MTGDARAFIARTPVHVWWALTWLGVTCMTVAVLFPVFFERDMLTKLQDEILVFRNLVDQGDLIMRRANTTEMRKTELLTDLKRIDQTYLAPSADALPWAVKTVTQYGQIAGIRVGEVTEVVDNAPPWQGLPLPARKFVPFAVRVDVEGRVEHVARFMKLIEKDNPYVTFTSFILLDRKVDSEERAVALVIEWPMWDRNETAARARRLLSHN